PSERSVASRAAGKGGNGPSFDASLTTRPRPSSRWTSSTGLPGSYGTRSAIARRKVTIRSCRLARTPAQPVEERSPGRAEGGRDGAARARARRRLLRLLADDRLSHLERDVPQNRVPSVDDRHVS